MKKSVSTSLSLLLAFAVFAPMAQAEQPPRRKSFFESLFGAPTTPRRQTNRLWERKRDGNYDDSVRIIYGTDEPSKKPAKKLRTAQPAPKKKKPAAFVDPEVSEGLGYGKLVYQLPKTVGVYDKALAKLATSEPESTALRLVLADTESPITATPDVRAAVIEHYKSTGFKPLWTKEGKLTDRAISLLAYLAGSAADGMQPERYLPPGLTSFAEPQQQIDGQSLAAAQVDVGLTVAAVTFAQHMSGGAFEANKMSAYNDVAPPTVDAAAAVRVLAFSPFPDRYLAGLAPTHPAYAAFKTALAGLDTVADNQPSFPAGKTIRVGRKDSRIPVLRQRLLDEGLMTLEEAVVSPEVNQVLDKKLSKALVRYQAKAGIPQTGMLDSASVKALNGLDRAEQRQRLLTNMDRLRWLPRDLGKRHVFVNQAAYHVDVMQDGKPIWQSKVIVGRPTTQTAVFNDAMETVVFNPSWGVPQSIILNEYLPKLRRDPGYLDRIGFKAINEKGKVVSSRAINWSSVGSKSQIGIQQPPGDGNALGELKFLFPNKHSIYMHDTPNRELFGQSARAFSHGCVRVENPREFAAVMLGWDAARVDAAVESGESRSIALPNPVPVHLAYFTAWPDETGKIQYFTDFYQRDSTFVEARNLVARKWSTGDAARVVSNDPAASETNLQ